MEMAVEVLLSILGITIGGVSLATIAICFFILAGRIKSTAISKKHVEEAFQKAVLPADVRLNLSNKVMPMLKELTEEVKKQLLKAQEEGNMELARMREQIKLVLTILSHFNHIEKLDKYQKAQICNILKNDTSVEVQMSED